MESSILRSQLRVNDVLVKLNGVDPGIKFRDVRGLYNYMSKALTVNLTIKRPFSNEGNDKLPINAAIVGSMYTSSTISDHSCCGPMSSARGKRKRNEKQHGRIDDCHEIVEISTTQNTRNMKSPEALYGIKFRQNSDNSDLQDPEDDDDNDVQYIGGNDDTALYNMPHHREHCPIYIFQPLNEEIQQQDTESDDAWRNVVKINKSICKYCYCHVCQIKASDCTSWEIHCTHSLKCGIYFPKRRETGGTVAATTTAANDAEDAVVDWASNNGYTS